jgi:hypothetical protein
MGSVSRHLLEVLFLSSLGPLDIEVGTDLAMGFL